MTAPVTIRPDSGPDLRFAGAVVAEVSSHEPGRDQWSVLRLWRTDRGAYVVVRERWREGDTEPEGLAAAACPSGADVVRWLHGGGRRASWLTKELLDAAGIDHAEEV